MEGTTLAGSAQFKRKNLSKLPPSAMRSHVYSHTHTLIISNHQRGAWWTDEELERVGGGHRV
jgi:hypothetical protein